VAQRAILKQKFQERLRQYLKEHNIFWDDATDEDVYITWLYHYHWHSPELLDPVEPSN
jgi:hypothetical protein